MPIGLTECYNFSVLINGSPGQTISESETEMERMKAIRGKAATMLEQQILPFWMSLNDAENGGYYGFVDNQGIVRRDTVKGVIQHSRILYSFSEAYRVTGKEEYLFEANHAYDFLVNNALDKEFGGLFWSVNPDGTPTDTFKHSYNQAFGVYAFATYFLATGKPDALTNAMTLFHLIEEKWMDGIGYLEQLSIDFHPVRNSELSENNVVAERTMNTLLHLMEAYTVLLEATGSPEVRESLVFTIRQMINDVYNPEKERLEVFFDINFRPLLDLHSYGHDIEASWLIDRALEYAKEPALLQVASSVTKKLYDHVTARALTPRGLYYECENGVDNTQRDWWVQAEAVVGIINDMQKFGDKNSHLDEIEKILSFIDCEMVLPSGEWVWTVFEDGSTDAHRETAGLWKCPYHNSRMCMEIIKRLS